MNYLDEGFRLLYALFLTSTFDAKGLEIHEEDITVRAKEGYIRLSTKNKEIDIIGLTIYFKKSVVVPSLGAYSIKVIGNTFIKEQMKREILRAYELFLGRYLINDGSINQVIKYGYRSCGPTCETGAKRTKGYILH